MKPLFYSIVTLMCLASCDKDPDPKDDFVYCADRISHFKEHINYEGHINFCDSLPSTQSFTPASASTTFLDSNTVMIHLSADSIHFDTTLVYDFQCSIFPEVSLSLSLAGQTDYDKGYFSRDDIGMDVTGYFHIEFGNTNCLTNAVFYGLSQQ